MKMIREKTPNMKIDQFIIFSISEKPFPKSLKITGKEEELLFIPASIIDMIIRFLFERPFWHRETLNSEKGEINPLLSSNPHLREGESPGLEKGSFRTSPGSPPFPSTHKKPLRRGEGV
jgi:hypothetical protein